MCVCYPGTVLEIKEHSAVVDFSGTRVEALNGMEDLKTGDRVLVHAGCILQVLPESEAEEIEELFRQIEEYRKEELG